MKKIIIVAERYYEKAKEIYKDKYILLPSVRCSTLSEPICDHPDMVLFRAEDNTLITAPNTYSYYKTLLSPFNVKIVQGETVLRSNYPFDIAYNVARVSGCAFCKSDFTDPIVKKYLGKNKIINVRQGYAKCSTAIINNSVITADMSIYRQATGNNINTLLISPKHIILDGLNYGFIGGATGEADNTLLFFGDLSAHPDYLKIIKFLNENKLNYHFYDKMMLTDVGTLFCIN